MRVDEFCWDFVFFQDPSRSSLNLQPAQKRVSLDDSAEVSFEVYPPYFTLAQMIARVAAGGSVACPPACPQKTWVCDLSLFLASQLFMAQGGSNPSPNQRVRTRAAGSQEDNHPDLTQVGWLFLLVPSLILLVT